MPYGMPVHNLGVNLQATVASVTTSDQMYHPHHPITCTTKLRLEDDGSLACEHTSVPPADKRTQACLNHSIAILLMELAGQRY